MIWLVPAVSKSIWGWSCPIRSSLLIWLLLILPFHSQSVWWRLMIWLCLIRSVSCRWFWIFTRWTFSMRLLMWFYWRLLLILAVVRSSCFEGALFAILRRTVLTFDRGVVSEYRASLLMIGCSSVAMIVVARNILVRWSILIYYSKLIVLSLSKWLHIFIYIKD